MSGSMIYKDNWIEAKERYKAWWEGEKLDRPLIQVYAHREGTKPYRMPGRGVRRRQYYYSARELLRSHVWGFARYPNRPQATIRKFETFCKRTYFGGEAFPNLWINMGPGSVAAYLGAKARFRPDSVTVWFETPTDWKHLEEFKYDPNEEWWQATKRATAKASEAGVGKWLVSITDLGGIADIAASFRGSNTFIIDLFKNPGKAKDLMWKILELWHRYYDELHHIVNRKMDGSSAWLTAWSPKKYYPIQCDFSYMLSPKLFEEFVLPYLQEQCQRLDHVIYHLDGPGQIPHLDTLLSIPELDGIQWVPGTGHPFADSPEYLPLYKRIQEKGKRIVLGGVLEKGLRFLLRNLSAKGLLVSTPFFHSEEEANDLLEKAKTWTR